ncbi:MAG: hypothetical protein EA369_06640 [Bradymonadales bacterium]|nr:MAG: hypothetical protein EA369_06640 [Bradymonadales bacterium]
MEKFRVFVFPLRGSLLTPRAVLPLNIFESRYLQMLEDSLSTQTPIVVCPPPPSILDKPARLRFLEQVVGAGHPQIVNRRQDGSCVILLHGKDRVVLEEILMEKPYIQCSAYLAREFTEISSANRFRLNRLRNTFFQWAEENVSEEEMTLVEQACETPEELIEASISVFVKDISIRQQLLAENDLNDRLLQVLEKIDQAKS